MTKKQGQRKRLGPPRRSQRLKITRARSVRLQEIDIQMSSIASSSIPSGWKKRSLAGSREGGSTQSSGSCQMCCAERSNITKIAARRVAEIEHELGEEVYHFAWDYCAYPKFAEQVMFQVSMDEELGKKHIPSFLNRKFQQFTRLGDCEFDQLYWDGRL